MHFREIRYSELRYAILPFKQLLNYFYGKILQVKLNYAPIYTRATLYAKFT
jgi:hypothetical protein